MTNDQKDGRFERAMMSDLKFTVLLLVLGAILGALVRPTPASADGGGVSFIEVQRSRMALESIAHSLERCAK